MYKPLDPDVPQYPVFAKVNGRIIPFLSAKGFAAIAAAVLLGTVLFAATGAFVHDVEVPMPGNEVQNARDDLKAARAAAQLESARSALRQYETSEGDAREGLSAAERADYQQVRSEASTAELALSMYSPDQRARLLDDAAVKGISPSTEDAELEAMAPTTAVETRPVVDDFVRFVVLGFVPFVGTISAVVESADGTSLASMVTERVRFARRQRTFFYSRMEG